MRILRIILYTVLLAFAGLVIIELFHDGETHYVTADALNIRDEPGVGKVIGKLRRGDEVTILEEVDRWGKLSDNRGWVSMNYLSKSRETNAVKIQAPPPDVLSDGELGRVCRATIAALMGRDPSIIQVDRLSGGIAYTSYSRPSDGSIWKNRCRVEGDRVIWSAVDLNGPGTGPGRWRTHPLDETITYTIDGAQVSIKMTYSDGSVSEKTYSVR